MSPPWLHQAHIAPTKLIDYLLNHEHPVGQAKARFFNELGFQRSNWTELRAALISHAERGATQVLPLGPFGQKYLVRGTIYGPDGRAALLLAVWIRTARSAGPRLVTAYPEEPL